MEEAMHRREKPFSRQPRKSGTRKARLRRFELLEARQMLNAAPVANDDFFTLPEDTAISGNLLDNDLDLDGDKLALVSTTPPSSGTLITDSAGNFTYTPNSNFVGDASFTYTIFDGNGGADTASVTVRVTNTNDPPDARNDSVFTDEQKVTVNVLANDIDFDLANPVHTKFNTDPPDALRVIAVGAAANGQTALSADGLVSYTPHMFFEGIDSFTYTVSDRGQDGIAGNSDDKTDTAKVTVEITDTFPNPFAVDDSFKVDEDSIRKILDVLKNDIDFEGDTFKVTGVTQGSKGIVGIGTNGANVLYTPDPNFAGADTFTYTITDSTGATDSATVTVTVNNTPDPPDAKNDIVILFDDSKNNVIDVLGNDVDPDGGKLTVTNVTQGFNGLVAIGAGGANVTYTPNPGFSGDDIFTYTISDPEGATDTARVVVSLIGPPPGFTGTVRDDAFFVRRDATGTILHVFANDAGAGTPILAFPIATAPPLSFNTLGGNDRLILDLLNGNPILFGEFVFNGGAGTDMFEVRDIGAASGVFRPSGATAGTGRVVLGTGFINLTSVELLDITGLSTFRVVTPNANDTLTLTSPAVNTAQLSGTSGAIAIGPATFRDIGTFIIDAATNDSGDGNDSLTINGSGDVPGNVGFMEYRSGTGSNTLTVQNGSARIDSTVAAGGSLDTTVATRAKLVTHRLRQNGLVLGESASAVIVQDGTDAATSVVTGLTIGTGATLDINDNALIINHMGASPTTTIREKILEARSGIGLGNGAWTGTGITSSTAAAANAAQHEAWSVGYAENAVLPLGAYKSFRGVAVDETAVLIAYTRTGDANLDGFVNDDDVTIIDATYAPLVPQPQWAAGDFDYNGFVDDDDVTLLGVFYNPGGDLLGPARSFLDEDVTTSGSGVVEPSSSTSNTGPASTNSIAAFFQSEASSTRIEATQTPKSVARLLDVDGQLIDLLSESLATEERAESVSLASSTRLLSRKPQIADSLWANWRN
jgi:hypothetical protein